MSKNVWICNFNEANMCPRNIIGIVSLSLNKVYSLTATNCSSYVATYTWAELQSHMHKKCIQAQIVVNNRTDL
jgi:hypothetical protein